MQRLSLCSLPHSERGWSTTQPPARLLPFSLPQHPSCHTKPHSGTAEARGPQGLAPCLLQPLAGLWELSTLQLCPWTQGSQQREWGSQKALPSQSCCSFFSSRDKPCVGHSWGHITALRCGSCTRALASNKQVARGTALLPCTCGQLYRAEGCWGLTSGVCSSKAWLSQS